MKRVGWIAPALGVAVLAVRPAVAQPRGDNTSPPPPGAPAMAVPARPMLTWFGVQVSDPPAVHLQLSTPAVVGTVVEGLTLIVHVEAVDLDSRQTWKRVDLSRFETMPIVSIAVSRGSAGADVYLEFKPGVVPTASPAISVGTDGFTYVLLDLSGARIPAPVAGVEPTVGSQPEPAPGVVEERELAKPRMREGFSLDVSGGIGISQIRSRGTSQTDVALSGLNVSAGGWLSDRTALHVRASVGTGIVSSGDGDPDGGRSLVTSLAFTAGVQRILGASYFLAGGLGLGRILVDGDDGGESGLAVDLRAGMTVKATQHGAWFLAAEVTPVFYEMDNTILTAAVQVGWMLY